MISFDTFNKNAELAKQNFEKEGDARAAKGRGAAEKIKGYGTFIQNEIKGEKGSLHYSIDAIADKIAANKELAKAAEAAAEAPPVDVAPVDTMSNVPAADVSAPTTAAAPATLEVSGQVPAGTPVTEVANAADTAADTGSEVVKETGKVGEKVAGGIGGAATFASGVVTMATGKTAGEKIGGGVQAAIGVTSTVLSALA